jgi:hypothetical protein
MTPTAATKRPMYAKAVRTVLGSAARKPLIAAISPQEE